MALLTLSNLGDSIPLSNLGGRKPPDLNNSNFLPWTSIKFCMVVGAHKTNSNVCFWRNWMKNDVTKNSGYYARIPTTESV